ncbi:MAG: alpha/beta hydrolase [Pseudomonadota bacterium]
MKDAYTHIARPPQAGAPLIFAFHGTGGDEHQFDGLLAEIAPNAGLVAPRGDVNEGGAARFFRRTGEGVYDMVDLARATEKMAGFIAAHRTAHPDVPALALGYSNGANILASLLFKDPTLFDAAALLHPLIPWTPAPQPALAGMPILLTAGRRDPICPWPVTESLIGYLSGEGADLSQSLHDGGHEIRPPELTALAGFLAAREVVPT